MIYPPLKRHVSLQPLSREHFGALVQARRLQRAADGEPTGRTSAARGFAQAWRDELEPHFADEERLLTPLIPQADLSQRLFNEHAILRSFAADLSAGLNGTDHAADALRRLGQCLHDHIRWEERILFPAIEQAAGPAQLAALGEQTAAIEMLRPGAARRPRKRR